MRNFFQRPLWRRGLVVLLVLLCIAFVLEFRLVGRAWFAVRQWRHEKTWKARSLWLPEYRLVFEKRIDAIRDNLSGLTWNPDTETLFAIVNKPPTVVELSRQGDVLRTIRLVGFHDTEAFEYIGGDRFLIAEERKQQLTIITLSPDATELRSDAPGLERLTLGIGDTGNKGVEGLAWDRDQQILYAAKERHPLVIYEVSGFPDDGDVAAEARVAIDQERDDRLFVADISGLEWSRRFRHLLVLSDASKLVIEVDRTGHPISTLSLVLGNGLDSPIPQAEGIALDDDENLYLVSEPNRIYVFQRTTRRVN